jgi:hypothetical protein
MSEIAGGVIWSLDEVMQSPRAPSRVGKRMKGRPFAMLGVDADADADAGVARKVMETQCVTWSNWHDRAPGLEERAVLSKALRGSISRSPPASPQCPIPASRLRIPPRPSP